MPGEVGVSFDFFVSRDSTLEASCSRFSPEWPFALGEGSGLPGFPGFLCVLGGGGGGARAVLGEVSGSDSVWEALRLEVVVVVVGCSDLSEGEPGGEEVGSVEGREEEDDASAFWSMSC